MIRVLLVGTGNVSTQLAKAWRHHDEVKLAGICGRAPEVPGAFELPYFRIGQPLPEADVIVIAVSDDAIAEVSVLLGNTDALLVHTSGRTPMDVLNHSERRGVFYPLQSFAQGRALDLSSIPICLEVAQQSDAGILEKLAQSLGSEIHWIDSQQREKLHLGAVFVNNFTNHLYTLAADLLREHDLDLNLLLPLIRETTERLEEAAPGNLQTGPALRNDQETMKAHLDILDKPELQKIYKLLSESIQSYHGRKL